MGALPNSKTVLLTPELKEADRRIGVNLYEGGNYRGIKVLQADARRLPFCDASFDLVLSNATLEHVPNFWIVCEEMKRVLAPGGYMIVAVPGFGESYLGARLKNIARSLGLPEVFNRATITFRAHDAVGYYRFSKQAVEEIILENLEDDMVWKVKQVPRIFGLGRKPASLTDSANGETE